MPTDDDLARATEALARARERERRLRAELRASERLASERLARLETIHRHSDIGFAELDDQLRYRHVNGVLAAINGLPADAHVGRTIPEVIDSEEGRAAERVARRVLESGRASTNTEIRLATKGTAGSVRDWSVSFHPVRRDGASRPSGVDIVVRDVTKQRQQERCQALERDVVERLVSSDDSVDAVLEDVLALLVRAFGARAATLRRRDEPHDDGRSGARCSARSGGPDGHADAGDPALERFALEAFDPDVPPTLRWVDDFASAVPSGGAATYPSADAAPGTAFRVSIVDGERRLGVLAVLSAERLGDNPSARAMLERLGRKLGAFVRRRDDELRIRGRERELDALTRDLPDALLRVDRHGRIVFANAALSRLFGRGNTDTLIGRPANDVGAPAELLAPLDLAFDGDVPPAREFGLDGPEGQRWYRVRHVLEREADGEVGSVLAIIGDITERRRIVSALAERERRLERTLEEVDTLYRNLSIGLCVIDRQHRVVRLNDEMARINGDQARQHLEGQSLATLHPVFARAIDTLLNGVLERGDSVLGHELDGAFGPGGARCHWIVDLLPLRDGVGGTRAVSCTIQDVTSRKLTEQRLAARAAVAEVLGTVRDLDAEMPDVLAALERVFDPDISEYWTPDPDEHHLSRDIFRCSERLGDEEAVRRYFGDRTFAPGEGLPGVVWSEGHARRLIDARHDAQSARASEAKELGLRTAFGFPVMLDGRTIGVVTLFMGERLTTDAMLLEMMEQIGRDIGECERRLRGERALEHARVAAERANRSKSDFLANVSHELRSPLTAILGYADILDTRLTDPDDRHSVGTVRSNGQYLLALLNDILDLAKIESDKFEPDLDPVALADLVGEVRALMAVRATERSLVLDVRADGLLPERIVSDELRLRQILINLIGNAIKFTDTGSVTLALRFEENGVPLLVFDVIDTGIGMTDAQCGQLFEPFTQVDNSSTRRYGGTGLGLAISRRLARRLGGELSVRSTVGVGTTFTLTIPANIAPDTARTALLLDGPNLSAPQRDTVPSDLQALAAQVLVADDRPDIRAMVRRFLESAGAGVIAVTDGEAVIEALAGFADPSSWPDAIVMDMQMPRLDGYEATRRIRANGFDRPIVALTAAAMKGERERCLKAGCNDYLSKPIDGRLLIDTLAALIERHRRSGEAPSTDAAATAADDSAHGTEHTLRVLLVDDSQDAATATARLLTHSGHDVRTAGNGRSALQISDEWRPHVVLLDIGLPDIDGMEVARRIRTSRDDAPTLIALSGRTLDDGAGSPFDHHLLKPTRLQVLTGLLASVAERTFRSGKG